MSVRLTVDRELDSTAQYVKDQNGNTSSLSLTKEGKVGIGREDPTHELDVDGTLRIKSSSIGEGIYFVDTDFSMGDGIQPGKAGFRLQKGGYRIFEVVEATDFFFDNVNVYPDDDNSQSLGLQEHRWSELHAVDGFFTGSLNLANIETAPPGIETVELVMDPKTGKIYRKNKSLEAPKAPSGLSVGSR